MSKVTPNRGSRARITTTARIPKEATRERRTVTSMAACSTSWRARGS